MSARTKWPFRLSASFDMQATQNCNLFVGSVSGWTSACDAQSPLFDDLHALHPRCAVRAQPLAQLLDVELRLGACLYGGGFLLGRLLQGGLTAGVLVLQRLRSRQRAMSGAMAT